MYEPASRRSSISQRISKTAPVGGYDRPGLRSLFPRQSAAPVGDPPLRALPTGVLFSGKPEFEYTMAIPNDSKDHWRALASLLGLPPEPEQPELEKPVPIVPTAPPAAVADAKEYPSAPEPTRPS